MENVNAFHKSHLKEFKDYLAAQGIPYRQGRGVWQELQVLTPVVGWQCIHSRPDMHPEYYMVQDRLYLLVEQFLMERSKNHERI